MGCPCESPSALEQGFTYKLVIVEAPHDLRWIPGLVYHDLYLGGKALVERENMGFDLTKSDLCPSFVEDYTTKGVGLSIADSYSGNHREDDFTPLETIRRLEGEDFEPERR
ncbi:hypothetical protein Tco_0037379, partial [Tanacetum coccineum]